MSRSRTPGTVDTRSLQNLVCPTCATTLNGADLPNSARCPTCGLSLNETIAHYSATLTHLSHHEQRAIARLVSIAAVAVLPPCFLAANSLLKLIRPDPVIAMQITAVALFASQVVAPILIGEALRPFTRFATRRRQLHVVAAIQFLALLACFTTISLTIAFGSGVIGLFSPLLAAPVLIGAALLLVAYIHYWLVLVASLQALASISGRTSLSLAMQQTPRLIWIGLAIFIPLLPPLAASLVLFLVGQSATNAARADSESARAASPLHNADQVRTKT